MYLLKNTMKVSVLMEWAEIYSLWCVGYLLYVERDDANGILYKSSLNKTYEHTNQILSLGFSFTFKSCDTHMSLSRFDVLNFFLCLPNKRRGVTVRGQSAWLIVRPVSTSKWILRVASSTRARRVPYSAELDTVQNASLFFFLFSGCECCQRGLALYLIKLNGPMLIVCIV